MMRRTFGAAPFSTSTARIRTHQTHSRRPVMFHNPCPTPDHIVTVIHGAEARAPDARHTHAATSSVPSHVSLLGPHPCWGQELYRHATSPARAPCASRPVPGAASARATLAHSRTRIRTSHTPVSSVNIRPTRRAAQALERSRTQAKPRERSKSAASVLSSLSPRKHLSSQSV